MKTCPYCGEPMEDTTPKCFYCDIDFINIQTMDGEEQLAELRHNEKFNTITGTIELDDIRSTSSTDEEYQNKIKQRIFEELGDKLVDNMNLLIDIDEKTKNQVLNIKIRMIKPDVLFFRDQIEEACYKNMVSNS